MKTVAINDFKCNTFPFFITNLWSFLSFVYIPFGLIVCYFKPSIKTEYEENHTQGTACFVSIVFSAILNWIKGPCIKFQGETYLHAFHSYNRFQQND